MWSLTSAWAWLDMQDSNGFAGNYKECGSADQPMQPGGCFAAVSDRQGVR